MAVSVTGRSGRRRRRAMSEINVVPYIDVMLVLLIIFMVTAPLLNLGVDIDLPKTNAQALEQKQNPIVVSVDREGQLWLTLGTEEREAVDQETLLSKVSAFVRQNPEVPVYVEGDQAVSYGQVFELFTLTQAAGVTKIGIVGQPQTERPNGK
ncbi:MAG TPA: protein TolR [Xanthomonadales bacterium]|nr:protein TolR [Xanthomonadales bacterium]